MPQFAPFDLDGEVPNTIRVRNVSGDRRPMTPTQYAALLNAVTDPFTQYALLLGRVGGQTLIGGTATTNQLILQANSANGSDAAVVVLSTATGSTGAQLTLYQSSTSPAATDIAGKLDINANDANGVATVIARVAGVITETTAGAMSSVLSLIAIDDGTLREIQLAPDSNAVKPTDDAHWDLGVVSTNRFRSGFFSSILDVGTGYRVAGAAASGNVLRGNGTNFVSSALAFSDLTDVAWNTSFTPVVTQSGTVTSFTSNVSRYAQHGKAVIFQTRLIVNNAGGAAGANDVSVSLPVTAQNNNPYYVGRGAIFDTSASVIYGADMRIASTTTVKFQTTHANGAGSGLSTAGALNLGSIDFTAALATGDVIDLGIIYEAA